MSEVLNLRKKNRVEAPALPQYEEEPQFVVEKPKRKFGVAQWLVVTVVAVVLATVGVKASDSLFNGKAKDNSLCPAEMVFVPGSNGGFCLDKYEAAAGGKCSYKNPTNQEETRANLESGDCLPVSQSGLVPWRFISQNQAAVACAKAGKRLPTNEEWQTASLATPDKEANWGADDCQVANNWSQQPGLTGSGKNCISGAGAYDLIGNVWEWVEGTVEDGNYKGKSLPDDGYIKGVDSLAMPAEIDPDKGDLNYHNDYFWIKKTGSRGIARGGYWDNKDQAGQYAVYLVTPPSGAGTGTGFRCAK